MLFLILLLDVVTEPMEATVMARPPGAPYVFYKQEMQTEDESQAQDQSNEVSKTEESESLAVDQANQISPED